MKSDYHANTVRYVDKKGNKSLIRLEDEYDQHGILQKVTFNFIGVGSSSGQQADRVYDFTNVTVNGQRFHKDNIPGTKEDLKEYLLDYFNKGNVVTLVCPKEDCTDPNCKPHLSIGNKIQK